MDFVSQSEGLVIEVDGGYHAERQQQEDDAVREQELERMGFHVMRFTNEEVLYATENVISQIETYCKQCGLKITKEQVIEIVQSTYDENRSEISKIKFVKDLEKIIKDENNEELIAKIKTKKDRK